MTHLMATFAIAFVIIGAITATAVDEAWIPAFCAAAVYGLLTIAYAIKEDK